MARPKVAYYRTVTLRALSWDGAGVTDHRSYVLDHDPPDRYQLARVIDGTHLGCSP